MEKELEQAMHDWYKVDSITTSTPSITNEMAQAADRKLFIAIRKYIAEKNKKDEKYVGSNAWWISKRKSSWEPDVYTLNTQDVLALQAKYYETGLKQ